MSYATTLEEVLALRSENTKLQRDLLEARNAGNQALRQWKMYAESNHDPEDDFDKSAEGAVYRACKAILTSAQGKSE